MSVAPRLPSLLPCLVLALAAACGDGGEPPSGPSCGEETIDAPPGQWTWLPVEGARCGRGSPTGMAINPGGDRLLIYMSFGGACSTAEECAPDCDPQSQRCALHLDGFDGTTFKDTLGLFRAGSIFDREDRGNPYRDHSFAFIPYCTGDFHSGDREAGNNELLEGHRISLWFLPSGGSPATRIPRS